MTTRDEIAIHPIGRVESRLQDRVNAPRQSDEDAPSAWLVLDSDVLDAMRDIAIGDDLVVITWLHLANRDARVAHPRGDTSRAPTGVFSTRSPDRPNPLGLHDVRVVEVDGPRIRVAGLEAVDGTPLLDLKPVLGAIGTR